MTAQFATAEAKQKKMDLVAMREAAAAAAGEESVLSLYEVGAKSEFRKIKIQMWFRRQMWSVFHWNVNVPNNHLETISGSHLAAVR